MRECELLQGREMSIVLEHFLVITSLPLPPYPPPGERERLPPYPGYPPFG